jgi:transglutaminase-like putative cysteine protease
MRLRVNAMLDYRFAGDTAVIAKIEVAHAPGQTVISESLDLTPPARLVTTTDPANGTRILRGTAGRQLRIDYNALVDVAPRITIPPQAQIATWADLPFAVLPYLLPSRFCPSDKFGRFVARTFGHLTDGGTEVLAIFDWIARSIDYTHGISDVETTAEHTFVDRAGVCRDFAHLAITLCRAANIPARVVAVYAWQLYPQDFHAVVEVYLDGGWWLIDPTRKAPIDGLVRIAHGRDAADIAFLATSGDAELVGLSVAVTAE